MLALATAVTVAIASTERATAKLASLARLALRRPAPVTARTRAIALVVNAFATLNTQAETALFNSARIPAQVLERA